MRGGEYLHLGSSTEHCLQSLHEVLHLSWEGCVLGEGEKGGERMELRREEKKRRRERENEEGRER